MKKGQETVRTLEGLVLIHHNLPNRHEPTHGHNEHQFFVPLETPIEIIDELGETTTVHPGQVAFLWARFKHSFRTLGTTSAEQLLGFLDLDPWQSFASHVQCKSPQPSLEVFNSNQFLRELLFFTLTTSHASVSHSLVPLVCLSLADGLENGRTSLMSQLNAESRRDLDPRILGALKLMEERHFEELEVSDICSLIDSQPRTLQRLFQKEFGVGPKKYLNFIRVKESLRLLEGSMPISQIAIEVGFGSFARYVEAFRLFTGKLPSDHRNERKRR